MNSGTTNNGGPAFPTKREALDPRATGWSMQEGMSLRDWFAGMALQGYRSSNMRSRSSVVAYLAYEDADAMLAARERKEDA